MNRPVAALILAALIIAASAPRPASDSLPVSANQGRPGAPHGEPAVESVGPYVATSPLGGAPPSPAASTTEPTPAPASPDTISQSAPLALKGLASWFCLPGRSACTRGYPASGLYAAAGPALRSWLGPDWRGSEVYVTAGGRSIRVQLVDWCACPSGRLIDLFGSVFAFLAPLSRGVIEVRVEPG